MQVHFFDGTIADSTAMIRLVGFNPLQQRKLQEIQEKKVPVELSNCEVKQSQYGPGYEVMLKGSSFIRASHRIGIDVPVIFAENVTTVPQSSEIVLEGFSAMESYSKVTIIGAKAVEIKDEHELIEQDVIIANSTDNAKVTQWDEQIGCLETGRSYQFKDFVVRVFQRNKYLSKGDTSEIIAVGDIGPVFGGSSETSEDCIDLVNIVIVGVPELDTHKICFRCTSRVESSISQLGRCTRFDCQMMQRYDMCQDINYCQTGNNLRLQPKSAKIHADVSSWGEASSRYVWSAECREWRTDDNSGAFACFKDYQEDDDC